MKMWSGLLVLVLVAYASAEADKCTSENCLIEDGCRCSSQKSPNRDGPMFVIPTFDDAITKLAFDAVYDPLLSKRENPDGNPISATFFVPHEYTDYTYVNKLYRNGHEIGSHSITKSESDYWITSDEETLVAEFQGQKEIISKFANIPIEHVVGARVPYIQLCGDALFSAYEKSGIEYDSTWTARASNTWFPYTLNYRSEQDCQIGTCPKNEHNVWVSPMNNFIGNGSKECNVLLSCEVNGTATEIKDWLVEEFQSRYGENKKREPMKLMINYAWFGYYENAFEGLQQFFDYLKELKDVFIVSESHLINWTKNPVSAADYKTEYEERDNQCKTTLCHLNKGDEERIMMVCGSCPAVYPWINNPAGNY